MRKAFKGISIGLCVAVVLASLGAYGLYQMTLGGLDQERVDEDLLGVRPPKEGEGLNILVIGSDERSGDNARYGRAEGARANVIVLAHFPPDRDGATLVSLPRDSFVPMPECDPWNEYAGSEAYTGMLNETLGNGGPPCVWKAVEELTGLYIDHFVKMDMVGFRDIVDAVDGVPICLPEPVSDRRAKLDLPAGEQVLDGEESLAFVRARYEIGDGTDLGRVQRQQMFMGALAREMTSREVLTSPSRSLDMIGAATGALVTDDGLSAEALAGLAYSMRETDLDDVVFHTVPWEWSPTDRNRVEWRDEEAQRLFDTVASSGAPPEEDADATGGGESAVSAEDVEVVVLNATGIDGLAAEVARELRETGYTVLDTGTEERYGANAAVIRHGQDTAGHADRLEGEIEGEVTLEPGAAPGTVELVLTSAWDGLSSEEGGGAQREADFTAEADPCGEGLGQGTGGSGGDRG